jgi:hypothetical protein
MSFRLGLVVYGVKAPMLPCDGRADGGDRDAALQR